jgi:hypothetical protein
LETWSNGLRGAWQGAIQEVHRKCSPCKQWWTLGKWLAIKK